MSSSEICSYYPLIHQHPKIQLSNKVWWFGRRMCHTSVKYAGDLEGSDSCYKFAATFIGLATATYTLKGYVPLLFNPFLKIFAAAALVYGVFNLVIGFRLDEKEDEDDLKNAFIDILGGPEEFNKLKIIDSTDNPINDPIYIVRHSFKVQVGGGDEGECEKTFYGEAILFTYEIELPSEKKVVTTAFALNNNTFKINCGYEIQDVLTWQTALLLKELVMTGVCSRNPLNPREKAFLSLKKLTFNS